MVLVPVAEATGRGHIDVARAAECRPRRRGHGHPGGRAVTHAALGDLARGRPRLSVRFRSRSQHDVPRIGVPVAGRRTGRRTRGINEGECQRLRAAGGERAAPAHRSRRASVRLARQGCAGRRPGDPLRGDRHHPRVESVTDTAEPGVAVGPGFYDRYAGEVAGCACTIWVRADADRLDDVRPAPEALYGPYGFTLRPTNRSTRAVETIGLEVDALRIAALSVAIVGALVLIQVLSRQATAMAADHDVRRAPWMTRPQMAAGPHWPSCLRSSPAGSWPSSAPSSPVRFFPRAGSAGRTRSRHQGRCSGARRWPSRSRCSSFAAAWTVA